MKSSAIFAATLLFTPWNAAFADDQALANVVAKLRAHPQTIASPIALTAATVIVNGKPSLKFHLTNISSKTLRVDPDYLPWGGPYSITWAALTGEGRPLEVGYPIWDKFRPDDPIDIQPGASLSGTYPLDWMLGIGGLPSDADITILWTYEFLSGSRRKGEGPMLSGVAMLHTPK